MSYPYSHICGPDKAINGKEVPRIPIYSGYSYEGVLYKGSSDSPSSKNCNNNKPLFEERWEQYRKIENACPSFYHTATGTKCGAAPAPPPPPPTVKGVTGLWYDPAYDGEGFNLIETSAGMSKAIYIFFYEIRNSFYLSPNFSL
jgi:hypothetical protein